MGEGSPHINGGKVSMDDEPEPEETLFTPHHREGLDKAIDILDKTFDAYVITYCILSNDGKKDQMQSVYQGGRATAIGLLEVSKKQLLDLV